MVSFCSQTTSTTFLNPFMQLYVWFRYTIWAKDTIWRVERGAILGNTCSMIDLFVGVPTLVLQSEILVSVCGISR
jgi:hypothetical protein